MDYLPAHQVFSIDTFEVHEFSFGQVRILSNVLAEITANEGAEINTEMVDELHTLLLSLFTNSFSLLINKINTYSTEFDALTQFGQLAEINKIAVFAPSKMARFSADFAASIPTSRALNIQVFFNQDDALAWLNSDEFSFIQLERSLSSMDMSPFTREPQQAKPQLAAAGFEYFLKV